MASAVGTLAVSVTARTSQLTSGLKSAGSQLTGFAGRIGGLVGKFGALGAAIAGVAGVAGLGLLVRRSFESIDSLAKMSAALGVTTENLAGLRRAAERAGVAGDAMEKGFARMQKSISAAAAAGGTKNFDALGVDLDHIRSLAPEDQFFKLAERINSVEDVTDRTRLAMEVFGREGVGMLRVVGRSAEAARKEIGKAAELGLAPSREDAALVETMNDSIADAKDSVVGLANSIAVFVAPALTRIADGATRFGILARKSFERFAAFVRPVLVQVGNVFSAVWESIRSVVQAVFGGMGETAGGFFTSVRDFLLDALILAEFTWANIGDVAALAWERTKLAAVTAFEEIKHFFTGTLPALFNWFSENWQTTFFTAFDLASTVFINLGENIRDLFTSIWNFIRTREWEFAFTPITDGFHNAMSELELPGRELSKLERDLRSRVTDMGEDLSLRLGEHMERRRAELFADGVGDLQEKIDLSIPDVELSGAAAEALAGPAAAGRGTSEAFSSILAAMRGTEDPAAEAAKTAKQQLEEQKRQTRELQEIARHPQVEMVGGTV